MHHNVLIAYREKLGYSSDFRGVCFGIAHMGIQAMLLKDMESFNAHIAAIEQDSINEVVLHAWGSKQKDKTVVDILAFLEGVEIYQQPNKYLHLLGKTEKIFGQDAILSASLTVSRDIEALGGLYQVDSFCGVYSKDELTEMIQTLRKVATFSLKGGFALSIGSAQHMVSVTYDKNRWIYVDANQLPAQYTYNDEDIVNLIIKTARSGKNGQFQFVHIGMYALGKDELTQKILRECRQTPAFIKAQLPIPLKIKARDLDGKTWLHIAAHMGLSETVLLLLQHGAAVDCLTDDEKTPIFLAVLRGRTETVKLLLQWGAAVENTYGKGITLLSIAVKYGYVEVFELLLQYGASVESAEHNGANLLAIATLHRYTEVQRLLKEKAASLSFRRSGNSFYLDAQNPYFKQVLDFLLIIAGKEKAEISLLERIGKVGLSKGLGGELENALLGAIREYYSYLPKAYQVALHVMIKGQDAISPDDFSFLKKEMSFFFSKKAEILTQQSGNSVTRTSEQGASFVKQESIRFKPY